MFDLSDFRDAMHLVKYFLKRLKRKRGDIPTTSTLTVHESRKLHRNTIRDNLSRTEIDLSIFLEYDLSILIYLN
jgi:hypothetical protein